VTDTEEQDNKPAPTRAGVRKGKEVMKQAEMQSLVTGIAQAASNYVDEKLSPDRATATEYYAGELFGNEKEGRSKVVMTNVRDNVDGTLPSFLRVIFGAEEVVEFVPSGPGKEAMAQLATKSIRHAFTKDNNGFMLTRAVFLDGMVRKLGVFKYGYQEGDRVAESQKGVTRRQLEQLAADPTVSFAKDGIEPVEGSTSPEGDVLYNVEFTRERPGKLVLHAVPPEEIIYNADARSPDSALVFGHRTDLPRGDLEAMGIEGDVLDEHGGTSSSLGDNEEVAARESIVADDDDEGRPEGGDANELHQYAELYIPLDVDGDGFAELRLFKTIGPNYHVTNGKGEVVEDLPFAIFCPHPEPHTMTGQSEADRLMDLQLVNSSLVRACLDSLSLAIFPRTWYVEQQVNGGDVLNTEIGAPIRTRAPNMVGEFAHSFVGKEALPILGYMTEVEERRTGRAKGTVGLDADALQSTGKEAVAAAVGATQEQTELLVRTFCEMTLKPLFRGMLRCLVKNQKSKRMIRLDKGWAEMDPSSWDPNMEVEVRVALGTMLVERKLQILGEIATKQENVLAQLGPDNPLCTLAQYSNTIRRAVVLSGFHDPDEFFNAVPADWKPQPQQPQPTPEQVLAQAQLEMEKMKTERELMIKQAELQLKREEMQMKHQMAVEELAAQMELKRYELELKYDADVRSAQLAADVKRQAAVVNAEVQERAGEHQRAIATHAAALKEDAQEHQKELDEAELALKAAAKRDELKIKAQSAGEKKSE
jgi:hypothetical protein